MEWSDWLIQVWTEPCKKHAGQSVDLRAWRTACPFSLVDPCLLFLWKLKIPFQETFNSSLVLKLHLACHCSQYAAGILQARKSWTGPGSWANSSLDLVARRQVLFGPEMQSIPHCKIVSSPYTLINTSCSVVHNKLSSVKYVFDICSLNHWGFLNWGWIPDKFPI